MLDHEDLKWIATTSTNLNSMLQQIARYTDLARRHPENPNYINLVGERIDLATRTAQALFDRVTSNILEKTAERAANRRKGMAPFTVLPPPTAVGPSNPMATDLAHLVSTPGTTGKMVSPLTTDGGAVNELKIKNSRGARELLLVVEDEHEVAEMAAELLAHEGYKVIIAHDGFEAL